MNIKKPFFNPHRAALMLGAVFLTTLTGCVGYVDGPRAGYYGDPYAFAAQDDYIYYPSYGVYYSQSRHQYAYQDHGAWASRPAPHGVPVKVLLASPSVKMNFHDSPAIHHAAVVKQYPRNWSPQGGKGNAHDEHAGNNGR